MSHFAKVHNGIVTKVIVAEQEFIDKFVDNDPGEWIQTSYNTREGIHRAPNSMEPDGGIALRKNFAGVGYVYDEDRDAFYLPSPPYPSWSLDEDSCTWKAPIPKPEDGDYNWNEDTQSWDFVPPD